jgi:hypothetical protein
VKATSLLERLKAWDQGHPTPIGTTLLWPRAEAKDRLVVAFVRMGGESSPWGVALGRPDGNPSFFTVPEPRNADHHAAFAQQFTRTLLEHLEHPSFCTPEELVRYVVDRGALAAAVLRRQLWLPGPTHTAMLHFLDFRYTTAATGEESLLRDIRSLGRAAGWLFRESTRPGQVRVHDATARLRQAFSFPAEPPRQAHLGFLLAWLSKHGSREDSLAAARLAEASSVSVTLDPEYEKEHLAGLVERWNTARRENKPTDQLTLQIHAKLVPELERRWRLTVEAMRLLDADPRPDNPQLPPVLDLGADEFFYQYWNVEKKGLRPDLSPEERRYLVSHPESDFYPAKAANRYFMHLHAFELAQSELVHGDPTLIEQAIDAGNGFRGVIRKVTKDTSVKPAKIFWTLETRTDDSFRLREDSKICQAGARKRIARIVRIDSGARIRTIEIEITDGKTKRSVPGHPDANNASALEGQEVLFLDDAGYGLSQQKAFRVFDADGPGAWLTHAAPLPEPSPPVRIRSDLLSFVKSLHG